MSITEKIESTAERGDKPAPWDSPGAFTRHWNVTLSYAGRTMTLDFWQGVAHTDEPTTAEIVACIASDSNTLDYCNGFSDWADEYGYDTDSRAAEATYNAVKAQRDAFATLMGDDYAAAVQEGTES